jgi:hypothetical protein
MWDGRVWLVVQLVWLAIVSVSKLGLFFFLLAFRQGFDDWGHFLFRPLRGHPQAELVSTRMTYRG